MMICITFGIPRMTVFFMMGAVWNNTNVVLAPNVEFKSMGESDEVILDSIAMWAIKADEELHRLYNMW